MRLPFINDLTCKSFFFISKNKTTSTPETRPKPNSKVLVVPFRWASSRYAQNFHHVGNTQEMITAEDLTSIWSWSCFFRPPWSWLWWGFLDTKGAFLMYTDGTCQQCCEGTNKHLIPLVKDRFFFEKGYCRSAGVLHYFLFIDIMRIYFFTYVQRHYKVFIHPSFDLLRYFLLQSVTDEKRLFSKHRTTPLFCRQDFQISIHFYTSIYTITWPLLPLLSTFVKLL